MGHMDDPDDDTVVEDLIDHPELAPPRRVASFQLAAKWFPDAVGILSEGAANECPLCNGHRFR